MADKNTPVKRFNNYSTPEQVGANSFTSTLGVLCEKNNLFGLYVKESNGSDPAYDEMYFICGLDEDSVRKAYKNVVKEYEDQKNKSDKFKLLHVTKLTGQSPFSSYMDVANYCLHATTIRGICNKYGFDKKFEEVSANFVKVLEASYLDTFESGISAHEKRKREAIVKEFLEKQGDREFKKEKEKIPKIEAAPINSNLPNMISFNDLMFTNKHLSRMTAGSQKELDSMLAFFKQNPHIPFYQTKPIVHKLHIADNRMFGSKENNTFYSCMIMYPSNFRKEVDLAYIKATSDPAVKFAPPPEYINDTELCSFGVSAHDLEDVFKTAKSKGIPLWIDPEQLYYSCDPNENPSTIQAGYKVNGPISLQKKIGLMLNEYAVGFTGRRILSYDDLNTYNKNNPNALTYSQYRLNTYGVSPDR